MTTPLDSHPIPVEPIHSTELTERNQPSKDSPLSPHGRFTRMSYLAWLFITGMVYSCALFIAFGCAVYAIATSGIDFFDFQPLTSTFSGWCATLIAIVSVLIYGYVTICISIRRLHDLNRSGWLVLLVFVPIIGVLFMLYLYFTKGDLGANRYGDYRPTEQTEKALGIIFAIIFGVYTIATLALSLALPNLLSEQLSSSHEQSTELMDQESTKQVEVDQVPQHVDEPITREQPQQIESSVNTGVDDSIDTVLDDAEPTQDQTDPDPMTEQDSTEAVEAPEQ